MMLTVKFTCSEITFSLCNTALNFKRKIIRKRMNEKKMRNLRKTQKVVYFRRVVSRWCTSGRWCEGGVLPEVYIFAGVSFLKKAPPQMFSFEIFFLEKLHIFRVICEQELCILFTTLKLCKRQENLTKRNISSNVKPKSKLNTFA